VAVTAGCAVLVQRLDTAAGAGSSTPRRRPQGRAASENRRSATRSLVRRSGAVAGLALVATSHQLRRPSQSSASTADVGAAVDGGPE